MPGVPLQRSGGASLLAAAVLLGLGAGPPSARAQSDADIHARIDAWRPLAAAIVVDGDDADWAACPASRTPPATRARTRERT